MTKMTTDDLPPRVRALLIKLAEVGITPDKLPIRGNDELLRVPGIGPRTLLTVREYFPFDQAAALKECQLTSRILTAQVERLSALLGETAATRNEPLECGAFHNARLARIKMGDSREGAVMILHGRPETLTILRFKLDLDARLSRKIEARGFGDATSLTWSLNESFFFLRYVKNVQMTPLKRMTGYSRLALSFEMEHAVLRFDVFTSDQV